MVNTSSFWPKAALPRAITHLYPSYFPWLTLLAFKNQTHKQKLMMIYFEGHLKEPVSHGPWKSFSRGIHAWSTHNNMGIRMWLIPSRPRRSTLKNTNSYLLNNNIRSENTQHYRIVHNILCGCTHIRQWVCLPSIEQGWPQSKSHFSFPMPKRHRKCTIGGCWPIYWPEVKGHYTINDKLSEGKIYMLPCLFFAVLFSTTESY